MRKRRLLIALGVVLILAVLGLLVWMRARTAPEAVRLLPECDAVIYINLKPLRAASVFASLPEARRDAEYDEFVRGTGFQFERDLHQAAFAVHQPGSPQNPDNEARFSEIFVGRFDYDKVTEYLRKKSQIVDKYHDTEVFTIPVEGRTVRVAILSVDMVAVSNVAPAQVLESIIDRARGVGLPFAGPDIVRAYHRQVPFGSLAWSVAAISRSGRRNFTLPGGLELPLPQNTTLVSSVRFSGNIEVKGEAFTPSEEDAKSLTENTSLLLTLFRSIQSNVATTGSDPDVKAFFDSLQVKQDDNRVVITASLSPAFVHKIMQEAPSAVAPQAPGALPPKKRPRKQRR